MARKTTILSTLGRSEASQILMAAPGGASGGTVGGAGGGPGPTTSGSSVPHKRALSPTEYGSIGAGGGGGGGKRGDDRGGPSDYGQSHKRQRPMFPPPRGDRGDRDRGRDGRWDRPGPRRKGR